jgi:uncharacterized membrane protein YphA (DoxX/SURF4 family)
MTTASPLPSAPEPVPPVQPVPGPSAPAPARWSLARRIAFRFAFAYLVLYSFPFPLGWLPGTDVLSQPVEDFWQTVVPWIGKHVLHLEKDITTFTNGSGDTTYNYVQLVPFVFFSALAAAIWSAVDRRRAEYTKAHDVLRVYVRYVLAFTMVSYGFAKLFKSQFPFPGPERLMEPLGEFSPMGLLWTFMGYSTGYNLFTGGAEFLGGALLFFRRTTTLGALTVIGVMVNVVALNFFYDVPVKIYSSHLLLMGVFLMLPDLKRLADVVVFNRPTGTRELGMPFSFSRREVWGMRAVKVLFVGTMLHMMVSSRLEAIGKYGDRAPKPPLYGLYQVESFTRDGQAVPALLGDATRWRYVAVNKGSWLTLRNMDDSVTRFRLEDDPLKSTATFAEGRGESAKRDVFTYTRPDADSLVLTGSFRGVPVEARLKRVDESKFLLLNRGFNWVQEFPFNR